jgi:peroxiredoxin
MKARREIMLIVITVALIVANGLLVWQNVWLKSEVAAKQEIFAKKGDFLLDFEAIDLDNVSRPIEFGSELRRSLLLYFHTECRFCVPQIRLWKSLHEQIDGSRYRIVAITTETDPAKIREFMKKNAAGDLQVLRISSKAASEAKLNLTPMTLLVNNNGLIEESWIGRWSLDQISAVNNTLAVRLLDE